LVVNDTADGRRARGDRTRRRVAHRAAELASLVGLQGISIGALAQDLGLSKSGIAAVYGSKQDLQLAAVAAATDTFIQHVIEPALTAPPGLPRLDRLIDAWLDYIARPVLPGGCFMVATAAEFDSHPGPVRDALAQCRRDWLATLARQVVHAQQAGHLNGPPADLVAFEIDAILSAAVVAANLFDDPNALTAARRLLTLRLGDPPGDDRSSAHR
jgi:AcrR family transcriptional regulator